MPVIERIKDQSILFNQGDPLGGDLGPPSFRSSDTTQTPFLKRLGGFSNKVKGNIALGVAGTMAVCGLSAALIHNNLVNAESTKSNDDHNSQGSSDSLIENSPTPTSSPSPTSTPSPEFTRTATKDDYGDAFKVTVETIRATQTAMAQLAVPSPDGLTQTAVPQTNVWFGEMPLNVFRQANSGMNVFNAINSINSEQALIYGSNPPRENSLLTSLIKPFNPDSDFGVDPLTEPGLGQTSIDMQSYGTVYDFTNGTGWRDDFPIRNLAHLNDNGLRTMGIAGPAHDKDSIAAVLAVAHLYDSDENDGLLTGDETLNQVLNDPKLQPELRKIQQMFLDKMREKDLGPSALEEDRIKNRQVDDTSQNLPERLRDGNEFTTCEVYRPLAETREDQLQSVHEVPYVDNGAGTFIEADFNNSNLLMVWVMDVDGKWAFRAFTDRDFDDLNPGSASGDQLITCGEEDVEVPSATPTPTVTTTIIPNTPTLPVITVTRPASTPTPGATQPVQPTATPGGNSTPVVPTPMPTDSPEEPREPKHNGGDEEPQPTSVFD